MSTVIPYFPTIIFNKKIFQSNRLSIYNSYDLQPTDSNIVSIISNDVKILINTIALQQEQINIFKSDIDMLKQIIKELTNKEIIL
jgi:hypothetical protein